jgi:3-deoxy-7-phosphoheptulonate synthase
LLDIAKLGLPAGCEFLDTITPQYTADLVSWGAIGARTTESQVHRDLTSALSMPTGFKNSTDGSVGIAIDACRAARTGHVFLSVGKEGLSSIIETSVSIFFFGSFFLATECKQGNPDVHIIMRGGASGPNYTADFVRDAGEKLKKAGVAQKIMVFVCAPTFFFPTKSGPDRSTAATETAPSSTRNKRRLQTILYVESKYRWSYLF